MGIDTLLNLDWQIAFRGFLIWKIVDGKEWNIFSLGGKSIRRYSGLKVS